MSIEPADLQLFKYYRSCRFFYGNKAGRARKGDVWGIWRECRTSEGCRRKRSGLRYRRTVTTVSRYCSGDYPECAHVCGERGVSGNVSGSGLSVETGVPVIAS